MFVSGNRESPQDSTVGVIFSYNKEERVIFQIFWAPVTENSLRDQLNQAS